MLYGLPGIGTMVNIPSTLYPSPLFQYDVSASPPAKASAGQAKDAEVSLRPGGGGAKGGTTPKTSHSKKSKKKNRNRGADKEKQDASREHSSQDVDHKSTGASSASGQGEEQSASLEVPSLWPAWGRVSSSESEYSDTEGGQAAKKRSATSKIRQAALACLHATIKVIRL